MTSFEEYLVGGAVRDLLLGMEPKDRDYVVVGATPQDMIDKGFKPVFADFPVFLDNEGNEYALARKERNTGDSHGDFVFDVDCVSLKDDLMRRDLTINSMAMEFDGQLVDYYGGEEDLKNKILRHVSPAFCEDPLRVLRIARFYARYGYEWSVAPETKALCRRMVQRGMLGNISQDRVWKETSRAIMEDTPRLYFDFLLEVGALDVIYHEIAMLKSAPEKVKWHPEGDAFEHTMLVLQNSANEEICGDTSLEMRIAALLHDIGKGQTPWDLIVEGKHYGHENIGAGMVKRLGKEWRIPASIIKNVSILTRFHMHMHKIDKLNPKTFVKMFEEMGVDKNFSIVESLINLGVCDTLGRKETSNSEFKKSFDILFFREDKARVGKIMEAIGNVKFTDVFPNGETNVNKIKSGLFKARLEMSKKAVNEVKVESLV